jgi:hypothetical protein
MTDPAILLSIFMLSFIFIPPLPEGGGGYTVLPLSGLWNEHHRVHIREETIKIKKLID